MSSTSLQYAIQNPINGITVPIISQSYGACEAGLSTADLTAIEGWLAQANSQGQTVVLALPAIPARQTAMKSTRCHCRLPQGLAVDYPGSSVYVTVAGGSEFMGDGTAAEPADRRRANIGVQMVPAVSPTI